MVDGSSVYITAKGRLKAKFKMMLANDGYGFIISR